MTVLLISSSLWIILFAGFKIIPSGIEVCGDYVRRSNENVVIVEAEKVLRAMA